MTSCPESDRALRCGTFETLMYRSNRKLVYHIIAHLVPDPLLLHSDAEVWRRYRFFSHLQ
jgi:hypothetical protein